MQPDVVIGPEKIWSHCQEDENVQKECKFLKWCLVQEQKKK
jgi:hypothetical protein